MTSWILLGLLLVTALFNAWLVYENNDMRDRMARATVLLDDLDAMLVEMQNNVGRVDHLNEQLITENQRLLESNLSLSGVEWRARP